MKIFYKKDFQRVNTELKKLMVDYEKVKERFDNNDYKYFEEYCKYRDKYEKLEVVEKEHKKINGSLKLELDELNKLLRKARGSNGGYICQINKLKNENKSLELQLKESMTNKYKVKKVPSGRQPKTNVMGVKRKCLSNQTKKQLRELN